MIEKSFVMSVAFGMMLSTANAEPVRLYAAGSLKAALTEVVVAYQKSTGAQVESVFGPSGVLRERIEQGEPAHVFASADMGHPGKLHAAGKGDDVRLFARNRLCALARPGLAVIESNLLDTISRDDVRLGISTPKSDPSGDYAWQLFGKAESVQRGSQARLEAKALQLTGSAASEPPPAGRNNYAWLVDTGKADVFLTYCTNAELARREVPDLQVLQVPAELSVAAEYGLIVLSGAPEPARALADFIVAPAGQAILAGYGFEPLPAGE
jgi:ABC-type molybdate transport system substrate-binding protein